MARSLAARRYARALFELAEEEGRTDAVRKELGALARVLEQSSGVREVLLRPLHPAAERRRVLAALAEHLGTSSLLRRFYALLIDQRRLVDFGSIQEEFERLADERAGLVVGHVRSESPLSEEQQAQLERALALRTGHEVQLRVEIDPDLLGGVVARVGDTVFDGTLRTQLDQLRASLTRD